MRLWPRSTADRIREAFAFLAEERGYRLAADSDGGMGGSITYRSDELWIAVEWDRSDPWLEISPTRSALGRFDWRLVDHVLRGAEHWERPIDADLGAPAEALAAWLRERLDAIELRFRMPEREATRARLEALAAERRLLLEQRWASLSHRADRDTRA